MREHERVVARVPAAAVFVPCEQRKAQHPLRLKAAALDAELVSDLEAQHAENLVGSVALVGDHADQVARLGSRRVPQRTHLGVGEELRDGALDVALARDRDPRQPLGAGIDRGLIERVDLATAPVAGALGVDGLDGASAGQRTGEHLELAGREHARRVDEFEAEAGIGPVRAKTVEGLGVRDAR